MSYFSCAAVSVELVEPSPAVEGDPITVCGRLRFEGSTDELQCAVTVNLDTSRWESCR